MLHVFFFPLIRHTVCGWGSLLSALGVECRFIAAAEFSWQVVGHARDEIKSWLEFTEHGTYDSAGTYDRLGGNVPKRRAYG